MHCSENGATQVFTLYMPSAEKVFFCLLDKQSQAV